MKREKYFPGEPGVKPKEVIENEEKPFQPEKRMVKRVCGECGVEMGEVEAVGGNKTHGLCPKCAPKFWEPEKPSESGEKK